MSGAPGEAPEQEGRSLVDPPKLNSHDEVVGRFAQYRPTPEALEISAELREAYAALASLIWRTVPNADVRSKPLALTHLEESMMFANKATFRALQGGDPR